MDLPEPAAMMERIRALPAAAPLLAAIGQRPGIHLVGGCVRDLLLGHAPLDLDVVVEGDALALARALGGEVRSHDRFGTVSVRLDGRSYDLAGARRERYARPGALPEVAPADLAHDLLRRDFTVNALAVALTGPSAGRCHAVPHALADLESGQMRVLHAASFRDDPTRLLRLARYAVRLDFAIESETERLAEAAVAAGALGTVSGPRVGAELRLAAREPDPVAALAALSRLNLDHAIHPQLRLADPGLARRALALTPDDGHGDLVVIAAACLDIEAGELRRLCDSLGWRAAARDRIVAAATGARGLADGLRAADSPSRVAAAIGAAPVEAVALAGALGAGGAAAGWLAHLRHVALDITGADLIAAGVPAGPGVGRGLAAALAAKLDGRVGDRAGELAIALAAGGGSP